MFLIALEWLFIGFVLLIAITQIFIPVFAGTALFPWFRRQRKLEFQLADEAQATVEQELKKRIDKEHKKHEAHEPSKPKGESSVQSK